MPSTAPRRPKGPAGRPVPVETFLLTERPGRRNVAPVGCEEREIDQLVIRQRRERGLRLLICNGEMDGCGLGGSGRVRAGCVASAVVAVQGRRSGRRARTEGRGAPRIAMRTR